MRWKHFDAQTWPEPASTITLAWDLRHGYATKEQMKQAAAVVDAYREILALTPEALADVIRHVRDPQTMTSPPRREQSVIAADDGGGPGRLGRLRVLHRQHEDTPPTNPKPACGARAPVVGWRLTSAPASSNPCQRTKCWPNGL